MFNKLAAHSRVHPVAAQVPAFHLNWTSALLVEACTSACSNGQLQQPCLAIQTISPTALENTICDIQTDARGSGFVPEHWYGGQKVVVAVQTTSIGVQQLLPGQNC